MIVPFLDLKAQYVSIAPEIDDAIRQVIDCTAFSGGPFVTDFEVQFAAFCSCKHAIGVGSGTEALWLALLALGIGRGDEVITVPNSFIATAEAISLCGATPVFIDVVEKSFTMNPDLLEEAITPKTKAIIPVHLFGQMADMDPIMDIACRHNLFVVEDACQAHGAEYKGQKAGTIGDAGCFSFYPGKNLGGYGEGGGVVTNNPEVNAQIRMLRDHGQPRRYCHQVIGVNSRMDGIQGAILGVKLRHLAEWNDARRHNAIRYRTMLSGIDGVILPAEINYGKHVYHIFAIRVPNRDELMAELSRQGVGCAIHYPVPIHLQDAYAFMGIKRGSFPVAEMCCNEVVSLPMSAELDKVQIGFVANVIRSFYTQQPAVWRDLSSEWRWSGAEAMVAA